MGAKPEPEPEHLPVALTMNVAPSPGRYCRSPSFSGWSSSIFCVSTCVTTSRAPDFRPCPLVRRTDLEDERACAYPETGRLRRFDREIAHAQQGTINMTVSIS